MTSWAISSYTYTWFIKYWSEKEKEPGRVLVFVQWSSIIICAVLFFLFLKWAIILSGAMGITRQINLSMLSSLTHASLSEFIDMVPLGRILNRFLKDTEVVDLQMPYYMDKIIYTV